MIDWLIDPARHDYYIDESLKVTWACVPKVASTSIKAAWPSIPNYEHFDKARKSEYFAFMFVRNPLDRFVSAISHLLFEQNVDDIIDVITDREPSNLNPHVRPQWTFSQGLNVNYIGKCEELPFSWEPIRKKFNMGILKKFNSTAVKKKLTSRQQEKVINYYEHDFRLFGYI